MLPWARRGHGLAGREGLPDAVGVALAGKYLEELPQRVWVVCAVTAR